jgi:hypothetical protein
VSATRASEIRRGVSLFGHELAADFLVLPLEQLAAPQQVDGAVLRGSHEPRTGLFGHARERPLLERDHERILCELFG